MVWYYSAVLPSGGGLAICTVAATMGLFSQNRELPYRWMSTRNKAFDNRTSVEVVKEWGFAGLLMVRAYLDRARGV